METEEDEEEGDASQNLEMPVDRGFSWVICFATFVNYAVIAGFSRSIAILLVDLIGEFNTSYTVMSLVFTIQNVFVSVSSILTSSILMTRYSVREISTVATLVSSISSLALSQARHVAVFHLIFVFKGLSFGCLFVGPMTLLGQYFVKRRAVATGLANAGFSFSVTVFPTLADFLRREVGFRGCLLTLSGFEFTNVFINLLLRPPDSYKKKGSVRRFPSQMSKVYPVLSAEQDLMRTSYRGVTPLPSPDIQSLRTFVNENAKGDVKAKKEPVVSRETLLSSARGERIFKANSITMLSKSSFLSESVCTLVVDMQSYHSTTCKMSTFFDMSLFQTSMFPVMLVYASISVSVFVSAIYFHPIAVSRGVPKTVAANMMSVLGAMDFLSSIVFGIIVDFNYIKKYKLVAISLTIISVTCNLFRFFDTISSLFAFAAILGFFAGIRSMTLPLMIIDWVGFDKMASGLAIVTMCTALTSSINHPIVGSLRDASGGYIVPLHYTGALSIVSVMIVVLHPFLTKYDDLKSQKISLESNQTKAKTLHGQASQLF